MHFLELLRRFYNYIPFIISKAHFPVKPNASLLGKICSPVGRRITSDLAWVFLKKTYSWASHFHLEKLVSGLDIWLGLDGPQPAQLIPCSPLNNNENIAAGINWAGCGPSSQARYPAQILIFFQAEND